MKRVVILGRGGAGKSTLARRIGEITQLPVIELDKIFWGRRLVPTPLSEWIAIQESLTAADEWIMDGDLGPWDAPEVRLRRADTVLFFDFPLFRCAWQALRRSRERYDFWVWVLAYRYKRRPYLLEAVARCASTADLHVFRGPEEVRRFVEALGAPGPRAWSRST